MCHDCISSLQRLPHRTKWNRNILNAATLFLGVFLWPPSLIEGGGPNLTAFRAIIASLPSGHAEIAPYFVNYLGSHSSIHPRPSVINHLPSSVKWRETTVVLYLSQDQKIPYLIMPDTTPMRCRTCFSSSRESSKDVCMRSQLAWVLVVMMRWNLLKNVTVVVGGLWRAL
ncbi:uncharacterized protein HD556DRAFT_22901 [Suillus plorans]|uniref:Uncharacterized protein n=1 Tax=Suillus plorans TaxID=116603 RepID=A0A9P7E3M1_9AGAM|nr:uncharacterized protein HD556DRAFT_22901 [Suillus plorans]KAG1810042.1 hypothetical protein HD556DRAFT_22901 [Suillus plorans]